jgi:DNA-binding beta-propeller fold protein YncE
MGDYTKCVSSGATSRRHRAGGRLVSSLVVAVLLIGAAAGALWWWTAARAPEPLEPGWAAMALVLAGDGVDGWRDGPSRRARFSDPFGVAAAPDGTIYIADAGESQAIRRISPDGHVVTIAGGTRGFADGQGASARFDTPSGLTIDDEGTIYVADTGNHAIRRVTADGAVTTLAGNGTPGYQDGPGRHARFSGPIGLAFDADARRLVVADTYNDVLRTVDLDGTVATLSLLAANGGEDPSADLPLDTPADVALDADGNIYVADTGNGLVRRIARDGQMTTVDLAGAQLVRPNGIAAAPDGTLYLTEDAGRIVEILSDGTTRRLAGASPGFREGEGSAARFRRPAGIAVLAPGRLVVADAGNSLVRLVTARSHMALRAPTSPFIDPQFDADAFARVPMLWPASPMDGPHEVAGTMGEARGGGSERFHAGIDVRVEQGLPVHAVRDGVVVSPVATGGFGTLNEWLRIGPLTYVHIRAGRTRHGHAFDDDRFVPTLDERGRVVRVRARRGARFAAGEIVATVNAFNHIHLNVGWPGEEHNPLLFRLTQFEDTIPPTITPGGVRFFDEAWQPLTSRASGRLPVSGQVRIVVDAWDQADGNRPNRRLGLYALGYQVLHRDGTPAPGFESPLETLRFDRMGPPHAASLVFAPGSGIPFYGARVTRFLYTVTNTFRNGRAREGFWDTTLHLPGDYTVRAWAWDFHGNVATRDVSVSVAER